MQLVATVIGLDQLRPRIGVLLVQTTMKFKMLSQRQMYQSDETACKYLVMANKWITIRRGNRNRRFIPSTSACLLAPLRPPCSFSATLLQLLCHAASCPSPLLCEVISTRAVGESHCRRVSLGPLSHATFSIPIFWVGQQSFLNNPATGISETIEQKVSQSWTLEVHLRQQQ